MASPDLRQWKPADRERNPLRPGFVRNAGKPPGRSLEKRAIVVLMSGEVCGEQAITSTTNPGWLVKTTRWTLTGWWHDVDQYRII